MKTVFIREIFPFRKLLILFLIGVFIFTTHVKAQSFSSSLLQGAALNNPTSLQFGPDGKLYVAQQGGHIRIFTINKVGPNNYQVTNTETILLVKNIPNHNDDGTLNTSQTSRLVTGILVRGTSANPVIYISSSDNRFGAGSNGDINLCTNSGIISKLTKSGSTWSKIDLVRGLPRSEENHAPNGLQLDETTNTLFLAIGGSTNSGAPSKMWAYISEYALTACILSIDLDSIEAMPTKMDPTGQHPYKYDIPTLDDPTRSNNPDGTDINDPWGGNDGLNQAKVVQGGPVQVYASGLRNPYDIVITQSRKMYTVDNGPNQGWGGHPKNEGVGTATNDYPAGEPGSLNAGPNDPMVNNLDGVEYIGDIDTYTPGSHYGGHPCPIRANPTGAGWYTHDGPISGGTGVWRTSTTDPDYPLPSDWPPVPASMANPIEGDYQNPGETDPSIITLKPSACGICEYTATNFGMQGNLLIAGFDGNIHRIRLNAAGNGVLNSLGARKLNQDPYFASGLGKSLDIIAQSDTDPFPGTVWVAEWANNRIAIFEPQTLTCSGLNNNTDEDLDNFTNADEIANGTDPCSGASKPKDNDGDFISDLTDTDDDNDGISDIQDYFAIDPDNGLTTNVPTHYALFNYDPGTGFFGLGFTGLMSNGSSDYLTLFNESNLIAGGATGALTVKQVPVGNALKNSNTEENAFQFGVNVSTSTGPFTVRSGIIGPFFNNQTPQNYQSQGMFIGTGDQDNYVKILINANGGSGGMQVIYENGGVADSMQYSFSSIPSSFIYLYLYVDPSAGTVQPYYAADDQEATPLGTPITLSGPLLTALQSPTKALAVGITSSSKGASPFTASWDFISVNNGLTITGVQNFIKTSSGIKVYPNPTKDKLLINTDLSKETAVEITIYNQSGKILEEIPVSIVPGNSDTEIDISSYTPGTYIIKINFEQNRFDSLKIIKQ
ncbi:MAG: T9SS type A sorting domain-containing protein [Cytophagaceae bacterium]|nr:T9SS type A sorting domain-containing protein [Cytophagaceae bacterium]